MERKIPGLCSESMLSSSLKTGFGLTARRIRLNSHTFQTNLGSMARGLIKYRKSVFSVFIGYSVMGNTFISTLRAVWFFLDKVVGYFYG